MNSWLNLILNAWPVYKYALLFLLVCIEGPLITMGAGWLAFLGYLDPVSAFIVIVLAEVVSDSVYYAVGRWGRSTISHKYFNRLQKSGSKLKRIEKMLINHSGKTVVIAKLTHFAGVPFLLAAGLSRIKYLRFAIYDTLATVPKSFIFLMVGFYFGQASDTINKYLEYGTLIISGLLVLLFVIYVIAGSYMGSKILESDTK